MDRKSGDIEVEDVYDLAAEIGDEFQKVIDNCGSDSIKFLMPKVIRVLEHLEMLAILKEEFDSQLDSLKHNVFELENDKRVRALSLSKYELEMESIEENWRKENLQLTQCVSQLRHHNLRLTNNLIDSEKSLSQSLTDLQKRGQNEIDSEIISLKESIKRSEHKVEAISIEMESKNEEIEKLSDQLEEVMQQNRDLRRRVKHNKYQMMQLSEARADPNYKDLMGMSQHIMAANNDDFEGFDEQNPFSLSELRNILLERNYLKRRLTELETEVNKLKSLANDSTDNRKDSISNGKESTSYEDLPVEGPINREPEDKLFPEKQRQNRILRFFPSLSWPRIKRP